MVILARSQSNRGPAMVPDEVQAGVMVPALCSVVPLVPIVRG
jgi:hypothetical protein